ncbi:cytochrome c oxidase subunit II [Paraburkholderia mimosarum]|uniref:cytochrome c oxidase subunit II n=1 Tax=Paraburkholderia mimosarum TaxID=312026 RepID=UPI00056C44C4|nr:c-type cytochrome [Paraburkholderia mimosarum]
MSRPRPVHARAARRLLVAQGWVIGCLAVSECHAATAPTPLAYFLHSAGPASAPVRLLGWGLAALCVGVCVAIATLLALAFRGTRGAADPSRETDNTQHDKDLESSRAAAEGRAMSGNGGGNGSGNDSGATSPTDRRANRIVGIGTAISTVLLFGALLSMLRVLAAVADPPRASTLTVHVTAYDWWWKASYSTPSGASFATANEIHIPTGEPVQIELESADVIHAFWVPALAGKTQAIPGQVNRQWIEADHPGIWRGQCTQFCGPQHAHMALEVVAEPPDAFARWTGNEARPAAAPGNAAAQHGAQVFMARCAACHTVRGTDATGAQGPDLTHLASRRLIAAGALANTSANRLDWVAHAQRIKPGSLMPGIVLTPADAGDLGAWLDTLQ